MLQSLIGLWLVSMVAGPFGSFGGTGANGSPPRPRAASASWYGDSQTQGEGSGVAPPAALKAQGNNLLPTSYVVINRGVSGETAHQIATRIISGSATACLNEPCGTYIVQGPVNTLKEATFNAYTAAAVADVALNGDGGSDGQHDRGLLDSVDYLHATHPASQIIAFGVLPYAGCSQAVCSSLVAPGARAMAFNAAFLAACATRPWLVCVSPYSAFEDPQDADHLLPAYAHSDGIHLVNAGSLAMAQQVYAAGRW